MFRTTKILACIIVAGLVISVDALSQPLHVSLFTSPTCKAEAGRPENVYCQSVADWEATYRANLDLAQQLESVLTEANVSSIAVTSYYLKTPFAELLARAYQTSYAQVGILSDAKTIATIRQVMAERISDADMKIDIRLTSIGAEQNADDDSYVFHPKVALIGHTNSPYYTVIFTSDNFNISTAFGTTAGENLNTANFENYNFVKEPASSRFIKAHQCMFDALTDRDGFPSFSNGDVGDAYEFCKFHRKARAAVTDPVRFYFLPYDVKDAIADISYHAGAAETIDVAGYNAGNPCLGDMIKRALAEKKAVRIITDDDVCGILPPKDLQWYAELEKVGAQVRYMQTNASGALSNRFHHKFMVFRRPSGNEVLTGSANFTCAAFGGNFEASYMLSDSGMSNVYAAAFDRYWLTTARPREQTARCKL